MDKNIKVFVYGTLKKGFRNHHYLGGLKGKSAFAPGINLFIGSSPFPFAKRGERTAIGELYEIDEATLEKLDRLEGHPVFYKREQTRIVGEDIDTMAWIYLYPDADKFEPISNGNFE